MRRVATKRKRANRHRSALFVADVSLILIVATLAWAIGWLCLESAAGGDGWSAVSAPALQPIPDGAVPREHLIETQCSDGLCVPFSASPPLYQPAQQSIPVRYIPGPQGPAGPQGPQGPPGEVDYERLAAVLMERIATDGRFQGAAGPPGPSVTEVDYEQLASNLRIVLAEDIESLVQEQRQQLVVDVASQAVAQIQAAPQAQGPPGPPGPPATIDDTMILQIADRVRRQIAGEIHYEFTPD